MEPTVTLSIKEYNKFRDFEKSLRTGELCSFFLREYGAHEIITKDKVIQEMHNKLKKMEIEHNETRKELERSKMLVHKLHRESQENKSWFQNILK